jgi:integrase
LWMAVCAQLCAKGEHSMAVFVLLSVECYLRPSEALRLRKKDLVAPSAFSTCWGLVLNPEEVGDPSKTLEFDDSLLIDSPWIQFLKPVLAILKEGDDDAPLFTFRYHRFVDEVRQACERVGLPKMVPYEMRHSGPSHDRMMRARSLLEIQKRGRWKTARSLVRYEKHTRMMQAWNKLPEPVRKFAERCQGDLEGFMLGLRDPPSQSFPSGTAVARTGTSRS